MQFRYSVAFSWPSHYYCDCVLRLLGCKYGDRGRRWCTSTIRYLHQCYSYRDYCCGTCNYYRTGPAGQHWPTICSFLISIFKFIRILLPTEPHQSQVALWWNLSFSMPNTYMYIYRVSQNKMSQHKNCDICVMHKYCYTKFSTFV